MTMIALHECGQDWAKDGTLLRVDYEHGIGWVATHYSRNMEVVQLIRGSAEDVHRAAARWALIKGEQ